MVNVTIHGSTMDPMGMAFDLPTYLQDAPRIFHGTVESRIACVARFPGSASKASPEA